ncbi:MAG: c-type cytochrome [Chitinophagales bacterium]
MKKYFLLIALISFFALPIHAQENDTTAIAEVESVVDETGADEITFDLGKNTFKSYCAACHTVGKGKMTGPDLKGVFDRQEEEWIVNFIRSSQTIINSGDPYAKDIYAEYNNTIMPDHHHIADEDLDALLFYLKSNGQLPGAEGDVTTTGAVVNTQPTVITDSSQSAIDLPFVRMIFWGTVLMFIAAILSLTAIFYKLHGE